MDWMTFQGTGLERESGGVCTVSLVAAKVRSLTIKVSLRGGGTEINSKLRKVSVYFVINIYVMDPQSNKLIQHFDWLTSSETNSSRNGVAVLRIMLKRILMI